MNHPNFLSFSFYLANTSCPTILVSLPFAPLMSSVNGDDVFAGQIRVLQGMGFPDPHVNRKALAKAGGKINAAIDLIVSGKVDEGPDPDEDTPLGLSLNTNVLAAFDPLSSSPASSARTSTTTSTPSKPQYKYKPLPPDKQHAIFQLHQMGFRQEGKARHALNKANWNVEEAVVIMLDRERELDEAFDAVNVPAPPPATQSNTRNIGGKGVRWSDQKPQESQHRSPFEELATLQPAFTSPPASNSAFDSVTWSLQPQLPNRTPATTSNPPAFSYTNQQNPVLSRNTTHPQPSPASDPFEDPFADDYRI